MIKVKNYSYRMHHDTGFAPQIHDDICILSGCKYKGKYGNIENWANKGSIIIGIGGNMTKKSDKLIYIMEVKKNYLIKNFIEEYPKIGENLKRDSKSNNVLLSNKFYYFGNNAISIPNNLNKIVVKTHGCKKVSNEDIKHLYNHINGLGYTKYGSYGNPNNKYVYCVGCDNKCTYEEYIASNICENCGGKLIKINNYKC